MNAPLNRCRIFWDNADPSSEGWAFRVSMSDGTEQSGPFEMFLATDAGHTELADAVCSLAYEYGTTITPDAAATDPDLEGGFAEWVRT